MAALKDAYRFTIVNGIVTAVFEYDDGIWKRDRIDADESYVVDPASSGVVIKS